MTSTQTIDRKSFSDLIRERMATRPDPDSRIIDYILDLAREIGLDEKNAGYLIDRDLKEKIEVEARAINFLKPL